MSIQFNLLTEQWIPVLNTNGRPVRLGILDALSQAGSIRQVAASNPMDNVALLRFLVGLTYWGKGGAITAEECVQAMHNGRLPEQWLKRLNEQTHLFNLLGSGRRFYQYGGGDGKRLTVNYLIHDVPTGTKVCHFRHAANLVDGLCLGCCSLGLLRLPGFATSGGQGKAPGLNAAPPVYVVPTGRTLLDTIILNSVPAAELGVPAWEDPAVRLPEKGNVPLLLGLSWLPRRVWLGDVSHTPGTCVSCGRADELLVHDCVFAGVPSAKQSDDDDARGWQDPHVVAELKRGRSAATKPANALASSDAASGEWARLLQCLLCGVGVPQAVAHAASLCDTVSLALVGFGVDKDKYFEVWDRRFSIPASLVSGTGESTTNHCLAGWCKSMRGLPKAARPKGAPRKRRFDIIPAVLSSLRPQIELVAEKHAASLCCQPELAVQQAVDECRRMLQLAGGSLWPGLTSDAMKRRLDLAAIANAIEESAGPDSIATTPHRKGARK